MSLWQPVNADVVTQSRGSVVRAGGVPNTVVLALADSKADTVKIVGSRSADVTPTSTGLITPAEPGMMVRMLVEPGINDTIYLSDTVGGSGDVTPPALEIVLGICYEKVQISGVWYAFVLPPASPIDSVPPIANAVTVAKAGGDFTSVAAAMAAVAPFATVTTPQVVVVYSGVYAEPPFTIPPFVTVQGIGFAVLQTTNNAADFITGSPGALLNYVTVTGPTGFGTAAIRHNTVSVNRFLISNVILTRGYYGLHVTAGDVEVNTLLNLLGGTGFTQFVRVDNGGACLVTNGSYKGLVGSVSQGFACTGPGSILNLTNSLFAGPGATGLFVDDDGELVTDLVQLIEGDVAIHLGNSGTPTLLARATTIREGGGGGFTTNIKCDTASAVIHFFGTMSRNKFDFVPGVNITALFEDTTPGEEGSTTFGDDYSADADDPSVVMPVTQYHRDSNWTGLAGEGDGGVTISGGLQVNVAAGYGYFNNTRNYKVSWNALAVTLTANSTEYIWIDQNGFPQHTVSHPDYRNAIVLAQAVTNGTDVVLLTRDEISINQTLGRTQEYFEDVIGPVSLAGGTTTINGGNPLGLDIGAGSFAVGLSERDVSGGSGVTFTRWYQSSPGVWVALPGQVNVDTTQYNDIASGLVAMTGGQYKKDVLYIIKNAGGDEYHLVYGQEQFVSQVAAEQGNNPTPPFIMEHYGLRSGGVVSLANAVVIASTTDARPRIGGFVSTSGVTIHGALAGLGADDHLQYLTTGRANTWHFSTPVAGAAHVTNGNAHAHTGAGDGGQVSHVDLSNIGINTHAQIDTHIANIANPHATTYTQVGAPPATLTLTAGNGLTGGGDLSANRSFTVQAADTTITVAAGGISVPLAARLPIHYQGVNASPRTTLTGAGSTTYPPGGGATKLTLVTPVLTGTYRLSWTFVQDFTPTSADMFVRVQETIGATTLWETIFRPTNAGVRIGDQGFIDVVFVAESKTFALEFHNTAVGNTAGMAYAHMDIWQVG